MFNTNTLGYKLVTGKLRDSRKHSEQLNKYLAGLFDADGCITLELQNNKYLSLRFTLTAAASVDNDFETLRSLQSFYGMGTIKYSIGDSGTSRCDWRMSSKESKMMFNLIGKHLRIKGTHFQTMINLQEAFKGEIVTDIQWEQIKEMRSTSREESRWLKYPKHLSYAWVAGYFDGDGSYGFRKKYNTLDIRVPSSDFHILDKLQEDFGGSILSGHSENYKVWSKGLGKGHIKFSLPFLKKMRQFSCIKQKYNKIQEMITYLEQTSSKD